jgi:hypothetical protein
MSVETFLYFMVENVSAEACNSLYDRFHPFGLVSTNTHL